MKDVTNPATIQDIVKFSSEMGVTSNAEDKFKERFDEVKEFLVPGVSFKLKKVKKFIGRLVHTTNIVPHLKCYMSGLYRWEGEWQVASAERKVPGYVTEDLLEWHMALEKGIGVLVGSKWAQFDLLEGWNSDSGSGNKRNIAWAETVAIRLGLIMINKFRDVGGKLFLVLNCDVVARWVKSGDNLADLEILFPPPILGGVSGGGPITPIGVLG